MTRDNGDYGVEAWAAQEFGWERTNGDTYFDLLMPDGTKVEAKGCKRWISDGSSARRRGRFRLWSAEHRKLADEKGKYLFAVYEDHENWTHPWVWRTKPAPQVTVDGFFDHTYRASKGDTVLVSWPDPLELRDILRK
jgi:hypothetical protein